MPKKIKTFRLETDLLDRLDKEAKKQMRSSNNLLEVLIAQNCPEIDKKEKDGK